MPVFLLIKVAVAFALPNRVLGGCCQLCEEGRIYVLGYPARKKPKMAHPGLVDTDKPIDYDICIPKTHPSGVVRNHNAKFAGVHS